MHFFSTNQTGPYHLPFITCHLRLATCVEAKLYTFNRLSFTVNNFSIMKNCVKAGLVLEFTWRRTEWPWATKFSEREKKRRSRRSVPLQPTGDNDMTRVTWSIGQLSWRNRVRGLDPPLLHFGNNDYWSILELSYPMHWSNFSFIDTRLL